MEEGEEKRTIFSERDFQRSSPMVLYCLLLDMVAVMVVAGEERGRV